MTRERFGLRTIMIPTAAVAGFFIVQTAVALVYSMVYMFAAAVAGGSSGAGIDGLQDTLMSQTNNMAAIYSILIVAAALPALLALRKGSPSAFRTERARAGAAAASAFIMVGVSGFVMLEMSGFSALGEKVPVIREILQNYIDLTEGFVGNGSIAMLILSTCILVPISEELIFRGIVQGELRRVMPAWAAILIQGVLFALVHGNPVQISYVIFPALILGLTYEWTRSIYVPIGLHMLFNFIGSALPTILAQDAAAAQYTYVVQIAMIPAAILGIFYLRSIRRVEPDPAVSPAPFALQPAFAPTGPEGVLLSGIGAAAPDITAGALSDVPAGEPSEVPAGAPSDVPADVPPDVTEDHGEQPPPGSGSSRPAEEKVVWVHRDL